MTLISPNTHSPLVREGGLYPLLIHLALALVFMVVILSAYLRLVGSGLGCMEWPDCYAVIKTKAGSSGSLAAMHLVPAWATVVHRLTASALRIAVIGITLMSIHRRKHPGQPVLLPIMILGLTVLLSLLGYKTPSPLLPWVTLCNLAGGMAMLATLWWLRQRSASPLMVNKDHPRGLRLGALIGIVIIFIQISLGGWVSANFAAIACTDIPGCGGEPWTAVSLRESFDLTRTLAVMPNGKVVTGTAEKVIHMFHRGGALVVLIYIAWLCWRAARLDRLIRRTAIAIFVLVLLQPLLGVTAIAMNLPIIAVTAHNAIAALLLLSVVNLYHHLTPTGK